MSSSTLIVITEDGGVTKQIIVEGEGDLPRKGQQVDVLFTGKLLDGTEFDSQTERDDPMSFILGDQEVIEGWEKGVETMKRGEKAIITCSPQYSYGEGGNPPDIPPNATLKFEIELIDFKDKVKTRNDYSLEERVEFAYKYKEIGNQAFKLGNLDEADQAYDEAIMQVDFGNEINGSTHLRMSCYLNQAAVYFKQQKWNRVIKNCTIVIEKEPQNVKAYFRRGMSQFHLGLLDESKVDLLTAKEIDPQNAEVASGLKTIIAKQKDVDNQQKKMWGKAFEKNMFEEEKKIEVEVDPSEIYRSKENPIVFLEIQIGEQETGRIEIELFKNVVPKAAENFRALCVGHTTEDNKVLHYKGSIFHRHMHNFMVQGGDFINSDGTGGVSIYGDAFKDENFKIKHGKRGQLSMANLGKNTNRSQFFITFAQAHWLDGYHMVFGEVISNLEFLDKIENVPCIKEKPSQTIKIIDCGEVQRQNV